MRTLTHWYTLTNTAHTHHTVTHRRTDTKQAHTLTDTLTDTPPRHIHAHTQVYRKDTPATSQTHTRAHWCTLTNTTHTHRIATHAYRHHTDTPHRHHTITTHTVKLQKRIRTNRHRQIGTYKYMYICMYICTHTCICVHIIYPIYIVIYIGYPDMVTEWVEHMLPVQKVWSSKSSWVKPITYTIDNCHHLVWHSALLGQDKDWRRSIRTMRLSGISGHGASRLISQWDSIIKSPWLWTVTSQCPSWYNHRYC